MVLFLASTAVATDEFPPTRIYQQDGEWKVDGLSGAFLRVYREKSSIPVLSMPLEDTIPHNEYQKYVFQTTAGPDWAGHAIHYFITIDDQPHFCARTWWGRRILINLNDLRLVDDDPHEKALRHREKSLVLNLLTAAVKESPPENTLEDEEEIQQILTAVYQSSRMQIIEAKPLLKQLEVSPYVGGGGGMLDNRGLKPGDIHPLQRRDFTLRQMVQRSLRGLGEKPREDLPATQLHYLAFRHVDGISILDTGRPYEPKKHVSSRHERTSKLKHKLNPQEVLDLLGPPDEVIPVRAQWRYDIDTDSPYSFLITWEDHRTVSKIERIRPPLWFHSDVFEEHAKPVKQE
jgi:hypothetical protein